MELTAELLRNEAHDFSSMESSHQEHSLYGVTDGKAVGTYLEAKFIGYLLAKGYVFARGNAASGLDIPSLGIDIKVTSIKQPQSSCPFRSIRQKVYGLGYGLIVFVYSKSDDAKSETSTLTIMDTIFVEADQTADFTMTSGLLEILRNDGNVEELASFMQTRSLTDDYNHLMLLSEEILSSPPKQGYLTISPALQWRLQYKRAIEKAGTVDGVYSVYKTK
ncbi:restriction endonuclease [Stenotrophomonas sp. ESTM1D_MKCIP4_1]|uniref:restriction endonuclease n=1 Tax=Stenotrophomonas sp. ESTM1D_MKCIP4_1 TaxID=2072414 RepID=UPI000D53E97E|nr:restriction endonuclease [Stenotrophomonas sp. ESTM1D_MKCIP4_1]AWH53233.1 restriction endonuclease [Stenotrophomonas sp. ESTM1D_MKCIP4_1]